MNPLIRSGYGSVKTGGSQEMRRGGLEEDGDREARREPHFLGGSMRDEGLDRHPAVDREAQVGAGRGEPDDPAGQAVARARRRRRAEGDRDVLGPEAHADALAGERRGRHLDRVAAQSSTATPRSADTTRPSRMVSTPTNRATSSDTGARNTSAVVPT